MTTTSSCFESVLKWLCFCRVIFAVRSCFGFSWMLMHPVATGCRECRPMFATLRCSYWKLPGKFYHDPWSVAVVASYQNSNWHCSLLPKKNCRAVLQIIKGRLLLHSLALTTRLALYAWNHWKPIMDSVSISYLRVMDGLWCYLGFLHVVAMVGTII